MTRSGYLPRVQDRSVHLTSGLDLFRSGQNFFFCDFPQTMRGVFKPHNSLRLFVFLGKMSVLLALSAKRPCLLSRYQHMGTELMCRQNITVKGLAIVNGLIPRPEVHLLRAVPSPTAIRLKGVRSKPTACRRSFRLRWWSGWHRGVLRGFVGGVWVLLALSAKRRCPQSKCQAIRMVIARSLAGMAGTAQMMVMTANRRKTGSLLMRQAAQSPTPIRLRGTRTRPIACLRSSRLRWWSGWHRSVLRGFAGWGVVLLALSAKPPCPSGRCQRIATAMRRKPLMDMSQDLMESPLKKGEANMQPHPLGGLLPTPTHLKGVRSKPTACRRSSLLRWWSGWHRGVLRGFAGWGVVLLALSAKPPCPSGRCQRIATAMRRKPLMDMSQDLMESPLKKGEANMQPHPLGGLLPTPTHLKGVRSKPTACRRSSLLRWWSGWHRGVLRGFAGGVWVLLALSGRPPCPSSKCQRMDITILSVAQAATVDMRAVLPCSGKIPPPQTPVMLAGGRPIPTR